MDALVTNRVWTALGSRPGDHAPRRALGRAVRRRLRVGVRDLRRRPAGAPRRRLCRRRQRAPAADVLRARRRDDQGRQPARRDRLEPRLRHGRRAPRRHRSGHGRRAAGRRDRAPLAGHHAAVADHARRAPRHHARPDDGPPPGQPHPGRVRGRCRGGGRPHSPRRPRCSTRWASRSTCAASTRPASRAEAWPGRARPGHAAFRRRASLLRLPRAPRASGRRGRAVRRGARGWVDRADSPDRQ